MNIPKTIELHIEKIPSIGFMRISQILKLIPVCETTWWNGCKSGRFPKPYKLGPNTTAWCNQEIIECIKSIRR